MSAPRVGPLLKWPGAEWTLAEWIVAQIPRHAVYVEPYLGSGAVFFAKPPSRLETINDLDGDVVNLFRVVRDRPADLARAVALTPYARAEHTAAWAEPRAGESVEDARRLLVRIWMNHGMRVRRMGGWAHATGKRAGAAGIASRVPSWSDVPERIMAVCERLKQAQLECRPALDVIARYAHADCCIYADPPYVLATRSEAQYGHEMTDADRDALLDALDAHPGPVLLSGYRCPRYDARLEHWTRLDRRALAEGGRARIESLWLNPVVVQRGQRRLPLDLGGEAAGG